MTVTHEIRLHGALHDSGITFTIKVRYESEERVRSISVEPAGPGFFEHVLKSSLLASDGAGLA